MIRKQIPTLTLTAALLAASGGWAQAPAPPPSPEQVLAQLEERLLAWDTARAGELLAQLPAELAAREALAAQVARGRLSIQQGELEPAIAELRAAAAAAPRNPWPALHLGEAQLRAGRSEEASQLLTDTATRLQTRLAEARQAGQPTEPQLLLALGVAHQYMRQVPEAIAALEEARTLAPDNFMVLYELGVSLALGRQWAPAVDALSAALEANPEIAYGYWFRALAAEKIDRKDLLINDLNRFLALAPHAPDAARARRILDSIR